MTAAALLLVFSLLPASCWQAHDAGSAIKSSDHVDAALSIQTPRSSNFQISGSALGVHTEISQVTVDVKEETTFHISAQQLDLDATADSYSGTLMNLPVGPALTFIAHAYNSSSTEIFSGTLIQTMTGTDDSVTLFLVPVDDGNGTTLPSISRIEYLKTLRPLKSEKIRFYLSGTLAEELNYQITAASSGGSFFPNTGSVHVGSALVTLVSTYTAADTTGDFEHTFELTNSQGNSVKIHFDTQVSEDLTNSDFTVSFYPVVAALGGKRIGDDVVWSAVVSDDGPQDELTYLWAYDGGLEFEDDTSHDAKMQDYSSTDTGTLTLTVTDENGSGSSTQIGYVLVSGLFPDPNVVEEIGILEYLLPDTGQTQSSTATVGEDADYTGYSPSFTDNGDGTVTDNLSTLLWQQDIADTDKNWSEANAYCGSLVLANYSDWRLPAVLEYKDIIDYGSDNPAIDTAYFSVDSDTLHYWSSDTNSGNAWRINFSRGTIIAEADTNDNYVRCVRGNTVAAGTLTDNGDNTVDDDATGLTWQSNESGVFAWEGALTHCETLTLGGDSDWRVPNIKEIRTLVDLGSAPTIDTAVFSAAVAGLYWSSTARVDSTSYAWIADFSNGQVTTGFKTANNNLRCVRGGQ